ncbi:tetratricopeptide repeat protein [Caulobacter hibisci]|uniref:Tetratricopeptide repeat protein n=1 Tax=Caulobacter hibisci TaxID=2035993 RepID=A0ABS0T218_9CAUL|nr:hypothetical protein [Caulobacter hibisci]MBI1685922.1 hypothetical protein [Caulobacter hibisci]
MDGRSRFSVGAILAGRVFAGLAALAILAGGTSHAQTTPQATPEATPEAQDSEDGVVVTPQARGEWFKAESRHFVVYATGDVERLRRRAALLEDFDGLLRRQFNLADPPGRKLPVYLFRSAVQYQKFYPDAPELILCNTFASLDDVFITSLISSRFDGDSRSSFGHVQRRQPDSSEDALLAAYGAHFFKHNFPYAYPDWLTAGLGMYFSASILTPGKVTVGVNSPLWASPSLQGGWLPMKEILDRPRTLATEDDPRGSQLDTQIWLLAHYPWYEQRTNMEIADRPGTLVTEDPPREARLDTQIWLLVHYLWSDPQRRAKLVDYLKRIEGGKGDRMAAWEAVFGQPADKMATELRRYASMPTPAVALTRTAPAEPEIRITRLSAGADDLLLLSQRLKTPLPYKPEVVLKKIRRAAAARPDDRFARAAQARVEIKLGDRAVGEALLAGLLNEDGGNLEALQLMAASKVEAGQADPARRAALFAEAQPYLAKAAKIEPDNYLTLYTLARTRMTDGPPDAELLSLLERATKLAPEIAEVRFAAGKAFIAAGDDAKAERILSPLAGDPYGRDEAKEAQALLRDIRARRQAAAPASL